METLPIAAPRTQFDLQSEAQTVVHRIYRYILAQPVGKDFSLLTGEMGFALFERYYQRHFGLPEESRTWERIEASLAAIAEGEQIHTFAGGAAGMAWGFLHLAKAELLEGLEADAQSIVEDLDEPLFLGAMNSLREGDYDYLHGGLGEILYFLERTPNPNIHRYIKALVVQLEKMAVPSPHGGITWIAPKVRGRQTDDEARYNLGLSHGTASIVAVLALLYEKGYERERCHALIHLALQWMWNVRNRQDLSTFPTMVTDVLQDQTSRLAWCYGDLGIASSFYLAGEKFGHADWKKIALYTIRRSASRRELADTRVRDAAICHGSAGVSHIYGRLARATGHPLLRSAEQFWLADTLRRARPETEADAFLRVTSAAADPDTPSLSLLEGEASIGIVLLTALGAPANWDRFLLLS